MNRMQQTNCLIALLATLIFFATPVLAHDLWITIDNYQADQNKAVTGTVFSSHYFPAPASDATPPERMDRFFFISPEGQQTNAVNSGKGIYRSNAPLKKTGTYVAVALPLNTFFTKTPEGYQRGKSRKDVKNPIVCSYSQKFAKAVFSVGKPGGDAYSKPMGHAMEIIPLKDPSSIETGDVLPVKVLMEGKPLRTFVYGTYAGFAENRDTFAYTTRANKEGIAEIKMIHDGVWVLIVKAEDNYPDANECDKQRWAASLTFEVKK
ncbi:ABC transporter [Desulfosarcina widdelii]|uniref:ABC transporter n=1 Tax=Desulfosarcina widdelii TaxID=947919 RepID=A0A5K7Z604_9BACT|nr:DUF4198 domain-containing protein [Desulfosarcina widdelii]BBO75323.1 ABC transporter [Desulfosarcina widdelii]